MGNRIVQINEYYLNVFREGRGLPIVLLHDWGASWHHWELIIPKLTAAGYAVYAPDLFGHGASAHPNDPKQYLIDTYYQSICSWMSAEGLEKPFLIGHSLGAYLGLKYAIDHPKAVPGMVLINPLITSQQFSISVVSKNQTLSILAEFLLRLIPERLLEGIIKFNGKNANALPSVQHQTALDYKRASPHIIRTLATIKDLRPFLGRVESPSLVIWGNDVLATNQNLFLDLVASLPEAKEYRFEEGQHIPHLVQSERFIEVLLPFVDQILLGDSDIQF